MFKFEVLNELTLKATSLDGQGCIHSKAGAKQEQIYLSIRVILTALVKI